MLTEKKSTPRSPSAAPRRKTPAARRERAPEWDEARLTQKRNQAKMPSYKSLAALSTKMVTMGHPSAISPKNSA